MASSKVFRLVFVAVILSTAVTSCHGAEDIHVEVEQPLDVTENMLKIDFLTDHEEYRSKISMSINSGCTYNNCTLANGSEVSIVNVTVGDDPAQEEEQHWVWSVIGRPTVQAAITRPGDVTSVRWSSIFDKSDIGKSILYDSKPLYTGAVMLMNLIEFNDSRDDVSLKTNPSIVYPITNFHWQRKILEQNDNRIAIQFIGDNYTSIVNETSLKGKINLTISGYSDEGFGHWLPHLSHSPKTCQVDIQLQKLNSTSGFKHSRFAIELYIVSDTDKNSAIIRQISTTLDDEHTPGIFKTEELIMPGSNQTNSSSLQSYLQWRPVVYTTPARDLSESTGVHVNQTVMVEKIGDLLEKSLLYALYGNDLNDLLIRKVNVTFGSPDDGFYNKTKYQAWTFTFGVGEPIRNGLSPVIVLVIFVMMGMLVVVFITASIVCVIKRLKARTIRYGHL